VSKQPLDTAAGLLPNINNIQGGVMMSAADQDHESSAFRFHGNWRAFLPIAVTNLLLTIVTLGIYQFWATTREFIDDRLEWTGKGIELFIGFIMVLILILIPFFAMQAMAQALALRGHAGWAALLTFAMIGFIFYLTGIARFRGLRYKLSRTYWHGIRGGSNDQGFAYGWSHIWKSFCGGLALYLLVPWSMMSLWNERWGRMSFGPHEFNAVGDHGDTFKRFLLFYLLPILMIVVIIAGAVSGGGNAGGIMAGLAVIGLYLGLGVVAIAFYAKFFRVAVGGLSLSHLDFGFSARSKDWFILLLGDIGLWLLAGIAVGIPFAAAAGMMGLMNGFQMPAPDATPSQAYLAILPLILVAFLPLAVVGPFIRYRHWKFFITHMQAFGEVNLDELTQSETVVSKHGEGLLDAFDVGAI
jgi:uncharacterized membrane protein YjgN (DUF898 family)